MSKVVTCLLLQNDKLLILKRSNKVRTYKGLWGGVAGYIEEYENPYETALKEIKEETGLDQTQVIFLKQGEPVKITDIDEGNTYEWIIHPFIFKLKPKTKIHIDWEHTEYQWIKPQDIQTYKTVPHFRELVQKYLL
jgi:8-oxo-dGTP pyrophosphatase MutT (NUDIX family)